MSTVTTTTTKTSAGLKLREYGEYKELFYNLTLRELRSKYKRSVIGWGWSMINPLANMLIYTIVFSDLFKILAPYGLPSGLDSYALMYLSGMLPWTMFQSSVMESMGSLLGNQNLIQKTYFPRELIPGATVASKLVSHLIEMSLLLIAIVAFGNWRALPYLPAVLVLVAFMTLFSLGLALLFSISNVFYRDIQHFANILFFIWMFLTPVAYPYYIAGGGLSGPPSSGIGVLRPARIIHLLGHSLSLGTLFKVNPMTDAVLTFQSFLYSGSWPSTSHVVKFASGPAPAGAHCTVGVGQQLSCVIPSNVSWFDLAYFLAFAVVVFVVGLWVFRKYESRLPEEL
jgi:homopolymeric O-antigen transport system permease protein